MVACKNIFLQAIIYPIKRVMSKKNRFGGFSAIFQQKN
ncbi:hypothetical protein ADIS_2629 [Lunatimonas lonarensis]|uniref:Uncharacterized protein n=1 Tax=Lunatimonas lonarensis TaxID=1232681 RepID=R7ZS57_9BACT|nr:hypothetical protein ADIS_2629 [Lunatimonas lonarensis]